jgi:Ni,Fe-hydrogenase I small subunit
VAGLGCVAAAFATDSIAYAIELSPEGGDIAEMSHCPFCQSKILRHVSNMMTLPKGSNVIIQAVFEFK